MATPTFTLINAGGLTDGVLSDADTNTGWTDLTTADTDIKVEGTGSMSGIFRADGEQGYYDAGGAPVTAVGKVLRGWILTNNLPYMGTEAVDPYKLLAYDGTTTELKTLFGSDTYPGGWFYFWQDMDDFTTLTLANVDRWGFESGHGSNAKNVVNTWADVLRYMDGYSFTGGTSGDKVTWTDVASTDKTSAYGIVQNQFDVFFCTGTIQIGSGATTTYFESDGQVIVFLDMPGALTISAGLYEISATGSGCDCVIKNSVLRANGTGATTRFVLDFSDTNHTLSFTDNLVNRGGAITFASGQTATGNTFDDCGQITHAGADMDNCVIKNYEGTANTSALIYNVNADPDGEMDGMSFTKGTAATHAIEFGTNVPSSMTIRNCDFSGYNAADTNNDSTFHFKDTVGTITLNLVGCTGNASYRSDGATINIVQDPVTITVAARTVDGTPVAGARVLLEAFGWQGTHDGANNATSLTDSTAMWVTNELVGYTVKNGSDVPGSTGTITANTGTNVTATLSGGAENDWDTGDNYEINAGPFSGGDKVNIGYTTTTASVTHIGHGLSTGDEVVIRGAQPELLNGIHTIAVTGANTYTYSITSGGSGTATGTPRSYTVFVYGTTDANGEISASWTLSSDQRVIGWIRKSTSTPFYKTAPLTGAVDSSSGASFTGVMILDE